MESGKGVPEEREVSRSREICEWEGRGCSLGQNVANFRFELGVESSAAEREHYLVMLRKLF